MSTREQHDLLLKMVDEFAVNYVKPRAKDVDLTGEFPRETKDQLAKLGLLSVPYPRELGGVGGNTKDYVDVVRILSKYCATTGVIVSAHTSLCCWPIFNFGTPEQKRKYLPKLFSGEHLGAFALTEPNAGTDSARQQTKAIDKGDYYEISGSKLFITNANEAQIYVVFALTAPELGNKGITAFIMEKGMKGFTFSPHEDKMGIRGSATCELIFDKVKVPKENMLGRLNGGFKVAMMTLDGGRIGIAAQAVGIAEGALERTVQYVKERVQFGKPLAAFQNTQFRIADMKTKIEASKLLLYKAAEDKDNGEDYSMSAAMAKLFSSRTAVEVSDECIQLHGGYGFIRGYEIERYLRDAKITEIYEGTSEVQRMVIAGKVLR